MNVRTTIRAIALASLLIAPEIQAQPKGTNYDESKVPKYTLPDPLVLASGERVTDAETWQTKRRTEILSLFETHVYGRSPGRPEGMTARN